MSLRPSPRRLAQIRATGFGRTSEEAALLAEIDALTPVLEAARAWAAAETETPHPSSTGVGDWAERRAAARDALLAAVRGAS